MAKASLPDPRPDDRQICAGSAQTPQEESFGNRMGRAGIGTCATRPALSTVPGLHHPPLIRRTGPDGRANQGRLWPDPAL